MLAWDTKDPSQQIIPIGKNWVIGFDAKCGSNEVSVSVDYCKFNIIPK